MNKWKYKEFNDVAELCKFLALVKQNFRIVKVCPCWYGVFYQDK